MAQIITIAAAFEQWNEGGGMGSPSEIFGDDEIAKSESWNNFTDSLCKDGQLTDMQYHHCPSFEDAERMNDDLQDEMLFLLEAMGVELYCTQNYKSRPDWPAGSTHWNVTISRDGKDGDIETLYSMGSAFKHEPELPDVVASLLRDADSVDCCTDFDDWANEMGYDTDSRKAYATWEACEKISGQLKAMFSRDEISDLTEIANEM